MSYLPQGLANIEVNCMALVVRPYCAMLLQIPESEVKIHTYLKCQKGLPTSVATPLFSFSMCLPIRPVAFCSPFTQPTPPPRGTWNERIACIAQTYCQVFSFYFVQEKRIQTILSCFFNQLCEKTLHGESWISPSTSSQSARKCITPKPRDCFLQRR